MDKGRVVEEGTHKELIALQGKYYELTKRQEDTNAIQSTGDNSSAKEEAKRGSFVSKDTIKEYTAKQDEIDK